MHPNLPFLRHWLAILVLPVFSSSISAQNVLIWDPAQVHSFDAPWGYDIVPGDFDGDGSLDLVTSSAGASDEGIWFHPGTGDGGFGPSRKIRSFGTSALHGELAIGDFDEDGNLDFVVAQPSFAVGLYRGDGIGGFLPVSIASTRSMNFLRLATGDFNHDSHLDVAVAGSVDVLLGDGTGSFVAHPLEPAGAASIIAVDITAVDVTGDGNLDLLISNDYSSRPPSLSIYKGDGRGDFAFHEEIASPANAFSILTGDFNEDSRPDIVLVGANGMTWIYLAKEDRSYSDVPDQFFQVVGRSYGGMTVADLDADGHQDLVMTQDHLGSAAILRGDGSGALALEENLLFDAQLSVYGIAVADMNGDAGPDIVVVSRYPGAIGVRLNRTPGFDCSEPRRGRVNAGAGRVKDVLFLNGSAGSGESRRVDYPVLEEFVLEMRRPPSIPATETAPFALYAWRGQPNLGILSRLPFRIGCTVLPTPMAGGTPQPDVIWNNAGRNGALGHPTRRSFAAPSIVVRRPRLRQINAFFIQGIIYDPASHAAVPASVTNGIFARPVFR